MRYATTVLVLLAAVWLASPAHACFFCEEGANNTALFVMAIFGCFMMGMLFICVAYARAGAFKAENRQEMRVLEVEGIQLAGEDD
jgi:site-specific recombinase